jgi:hypothetical protein
MFSFPILTGLDLHRLAACGTPTRGGARVRISHVWLSAHEGRPSIADERATETLKF